MNTTIPILQMGKLRFSKYNSNVCALSWHVCQEWRLQFAYWQKKEQQNQGSRFTGVCAHLYICVWVWILIILLRKMSETIVRCFILFFISSTYEAKGCGALRIPWFKTSLCWWLLEWALKQAEFHNVTKGPVLQTQILNTCGQDAE
jgi:hypothetical protein